MGLKNLHLRLKAFRLRQLLVGDSRSKKDGLLPPRSRLGWCLFLMGIIESRLKRWKSGFLEFLTVESVMELRSSCNPISLTGSPKRKSKEAMKKAYLGAKAKVTEIENADEAWKVGSASAMVMNGEKLVLANMGDYRAVVCKDGVAHQIGRKHRHTGKQSWIRRLISGAFHMPKVRMLAFNSGTTGDDRQPKSLGVFVGAESIDSNTEFIILASTGIWEVIKNQEAVNLIRHIENAQEAAECLAKEALTRMSRSNISCLVIHFD
ncbi:putative protein phosphatase 2C-like protein 44 [Vitis vinifera]|uniref:PPM-type phosphatase domain-containing protein n=1 Tax=Vitis vinifera TaxID=29760 RepID=A0A438GHZ0_VITVI|nr:putative protein phosphatase 2C-like protein 44 [Vitis vinifera]